MTYMRGLLALVFLWGLAVPSCSQTAAPDAGLEAELKVSIGNARFANNLYKQLANNQSGNVIFSPMSAHACLSMLYQGARGTTVRILADGLQVATPKIAADGYSQIMTELNNAQNVIMTLANKIYVAIQKHIKPAFQNVVVNKFQAEIQSLNFSQTEPSRQTINQWVNQKTRGRIPELLSPGTIDASTQMVLVNAVYFKASWLYPFHANAIQKEAFYLDNTNQVQTDIMHLENKRFSYKDDSSLCAQIIRLPYANSEYSMVVVLPHRRDALSTVESRLVRRDLTKLLDGSQMTRVSLALPKFKFEFSVMLKDALTQIGLGQLFTPNANLTGMLEEGNLMVSSVIQKAFINVNENGTEAAAATGIVGITSVEPTGPIVNFKANHPFVFLLVQRSPDSEGAVNVLFYGRVTNPTQ